MTGTGVRGSSSAPARRRGTRFVGGALTVALAAGLVSCSATPAPVIGIALPALDGRWDDVAAVLRDRLEVAGYRVDVRAADHDIPEQVQQVGALLEAEPVAVIVAPVDATSLTTVLDRAPDETEVVTLGSTVDDAATVDQHVAFDASAAGHLQAISLLHGLGLVAADGSVVAPPVDPPIDAPTAPFRIELFAGSIDDPRTEPLFRSAMTVLQPYLTAGTLVVASGEIALSDVTTLRGNEATAESRMTRILRAADDVEDSPQSTLPDAVLTPSDAIARGVAAALLDAGAVPGDSFPVLTGRGAELPSVVALLDGRQFSTLLEDPRLLAAEVAARVLEALRAPPSADPGTTPTGDGDGDSGVTVSLVLPQLVRAPDVDAMLIRTGFWSEQRLDAAIADHGVDPTQTAAPTPSATPVP